MSYVQSFKELLANPSGVINMYLAAGDAQPAVQMTSSGVLFGAGGSTSPLFRWGYDGTNLGLYVGPTEAFMFLPAGSLTITDNLNIGGTVLQLSGLNTAGPIGVAGVFSTTQTTPIAITTGGGTLKSIAPGYSGLYLVCINVTCVSNSTLTTLTVAYEDNKTSMTATITLATSVVLTTGAAVAYTALVNANNNANIVVAGTATSASTDLYASIAVFGL